VTAAARVCGTPFDEGGAMLKPLVAFTSLLALHAHAIAEPADDAAPPVAASDEPRVAITMSPVHLIIPMAEIAAEVRLADRVGVAAIAGIGSTREMTTNTRIALYEAGLSARYYVLGSFRSGVQLGAEAVYVHAATDSTSVEVQAAGLGLSPYGGYKWTHSSGFTLEGQLGVTFIALRAKASTGEMSERRSVLPMLNLQVGYSF
jgi:hypothetical protein